VCQQYHQNKQAVAALPAVIAFTSTSQHSCSPLDAGQTDVMIDRHERVITDFKDTERLHLGKIKTHY